MDLQVLPNTPFVSDDPVDEESAPAGTYGSVRLKLRMLEALGYKALHRTEAATLGSLLPTDGFRFEQHQKGQRVVRLQVGHAEPNPVKQFFDPVWQQPTFTAPGVFVVKKNTSPSLTGVDVDVVDYRIDARDALFQQIYRFVGPAVAPVVPKVPLELSSATGRQQQREGTSSINVFLNEIYSLSTTGQQRKAVRYIFRQVDEMLRGGDLERCDAILEVAQINRLSLESMVALLTITLPARDRLTNRGGFLRRVRTFAKESQGAEADTILRGL